MLFFEKLFRFYLIIPIYIEREWIQLCFTFLIYRNMKKLLYTFIFKILCFCAYTQPYSGCTIDEKYISFHNPYTTYMKAQLVIENKEESEVITIAPYSRNVFWGTERSASIYHYGKVTPHNLKKAYIRLWHDEDCCIHSLNSILNRIESRAMWNGILLNIFPKSAPITYLIETIDGVNDLKKMPLFEVNAELKEKYASWLGRENITENQEKCVLYAIAVLEIADNLNLPQFGSEVKRIVNEMFSAPKYKLYLKSFIEVYNFTRVSGEIGIPVITGYSTSLIPVSDFIKVKVPCGYARVNFYSKNKAPYYPSTYFGTIGLASLPIIYGIDTLTQDPYRLNQPLNVMNFDASIGFNRNLQQMLTTYFTAGLRASSKPFNYLPNNNESSKEKIQNMFLPQQVSVLFGAGIMVYSQYVSLKAGIEITPKELQKNLYKTTSNLSFSRVQATMGLTFPLAFNRMCVYK